MNLINYPVSEESLNREYNSLQMLKVELIRHYTNQSDTYDSIDATNLERQLKYITYRTDKILDKIVQLKK